MESSKIHLKLLQFIYLISAIHFSAGNSLCKFQGCKGHVMQKSSEVLQMCQEYNYTVSARCCLNTTEDQKVILGIDLSQCDVKVADMSDLYKTAENATVIMLEKNTDLVELGAEAFQHMTRLMYLSMPVNNTCPGGPEAWNSTRVYKDMIVCRNMLDICHVDNVTCPTNSHCESDGPGLTACLCDESFYGYKCLRQGTFPHVVFYIGMVGSTLVVSAFLWVSQRRKVKKT